MDHELWFTAILNKFLGGPVTALLMTLSTVRGLEWVRPDDTAHPIPNYVAMEVLVILVLLAVAAVLRTRLSVERPGKFQLIMELVVEFIQGLTDEIIGHHGRRYVGMLGTLGLFIALCNLLGLVPTLETPTARYEVTFGCAVAAFLYYNFQGFREHGVAGYLRHLCGPMLAIAVIMFPIEIISNLGRLLSLTVRLYANMFVGGILEQVFGQLVPIGVPAIFMGLHVFVSLLQAYIFMLLPAIYISMAVAEEH